MYARVVRIRTGSITETERSHPLSDRGTNTKNSDVAGQRVHAKPSSGVLFEESLE
jgi:hypothetical protein